MTFKLSDFQTFMDARLKVLPEDFQKRVSQIFPPGQLNSIMRAYILPKCETLRVNTLKNSREKIMSVFRKQGIAFEEDPQLPLCFYLKDISHKKITTLKIYEQGEIYLQNVSSQIPPMVLNPKPGEKVLDLCASPGSKTTQLWALMQNQGELTALEPDKIRFERLKHNLDRLGCSSVIAINRRGESFCREVAKENPDTLFDKILVDAPCCGDGTFYINVRAGFSHWNIEFVKKIAQLQKKLVAEAISVLKPGGLILYSTCSISPEENEEVIDWTLTQTKNISCLPIENHFTHKLFKPALKNWQGNSFSKQVENSRRIYPGDKNEGFYLALLKKSDETKNLAGSNEVSNKE